MYSSCKIQDTDLILNYPKQILSLVQFNLHKYLTCEIVGVNQSHECNTSDIPKQIDLTVSVQYKLRDVFNVSQMKMTLMEFLLFMMIIKGREEIRLKMIHSHKTMCQSTLKILEAVKDYKGKTFFFCFYVHINARTSESQVDYLVS